MFFYGKDRQTLTIRTIDSNLECQDVKYVFFIFHFGYPADFLSLTVYKHELVNLSAEMLRLVGLDEITESMLSFVIFSSIP